MHLVCLIYEYVNHPYLHVIFSKANPRCLRIHCEGRGDVDIGSQAVNLILSNSRKGLVHNGEFIQHKVDDVSLYISYISYGI